MCCQAGWVCLALFKKYQRVQQGSKWEKVKSEERGELSRALQAILRTLLSIQLKWRITKGLWAVIWSSSQSKSISLAAMLRNDEWMNKWMKKRTNHIKKKNSVGASLVVQWLRIHLTMQGTLVRSPAQGDPTCRGAAKPTCHNYWACAATPGALVPTACALQQGKPPQWKALRTTV